MGSERKLLRKIQKYEARLEKRRRRRGRRHHLADRSRSRSPLWNPTRSPTRSPSRIATPSPSRSSLVSVRNNILPADDSDTVQEPPLEVAQIEEVVPNKEMPAEQEQAIALLHALGKDYEEDKKYEGQIHQDISKRWAYILVQGLNKTERDELIKQYNIPENCQLLDAPKLNDEVLAALTESSKNRDKSISHQQQQLGMAVAILGKVISSIIEENTDKISMLKSLGDAAKLLTDLHHQQTKTRRVLVAPLIEKSFLQLMENTQRNEYLYGENLGEKIKCNKQLQQNCMAIKKPTQGATTLTKAIKPSGNRQGPPRQMNNRQSLKVMARGGPKYRTAQPVQQQRPVYNQRRSERTRGAYNNRR